MTKPSLLVADADPQSLRIMEVALRQAGFSVDTAADGTQALQRILDEPPDLVLCEVSLPSRDGLEVCRGVRADPRLALLPFLMMSGEKAPAAKARCIEAGADDFLGKPILLKELVQRVHMLIDRRERQSLVARDAPAALTGSVGDLGLLDVFQSLDNWKKSATVVCEAQGRLARVWVQGGQVIDAELGPLAGEAAFCRLMTWERGEFRVEFGEVDREKRIENGTQGVLMEAMRRVDELGRFSAELAMNRQLAVDFGALVAKLAELPDEVNGVLRSFDGKRTLREALDLSPVDDLSTMAVVDRLLGDGILRLVETRQEPPRKPSLQQWLSNPPPPPPDPGEGAPLAEKHAAPEPAPEESRVAAEVADRTPPAPRPLEVVHFPPLRGARRERLRREAEEARASIGRGQAVRLTHVVELPSYQPGDADALAGARCMSPAVGEAARKFAPDAPVARLNGAAREQKTELSFRLSDAAATDPGPPAADIAGAPNPATPEPPLAPVAPFTPPPQRMDRELESQMLAALGGAPRRRRRYTVAAVLAVAVAAAAWFLRPQPGVGKKAAPWLETPPAATPAERQVAAAPVPAAAAPSVPVQAAPRAEEPAAGAAQPASPPAPDEYAQALEQGDALLGRGKYQAALAQFKRAAKLRPQSVPALLALGDAYLQADKPGSAVEPLRTAARLAPRNSRAPLLLGTAWQALGKNADAVKAYLRYLALEPNGEFARDVRLILANLGQPG